MESTYLIGMKSERSAIIRARLEKLRMETTRAYNDVANTLAAIYRIGHISPAMATLQTAKEQLEAQLQNIWYRQELVKEPICKFCDSTWGLSQEIDLRYGADYKAAARAGCFWCCGWCYAHVLNAAYSNLPEMRAR